MSTPRDLGQLSSADWNALEELADRFEAACRQQPGVDLADFLPAAGSPVRLLALRELIAIDLEVCWRGGQRRRVAEYVVRFPELNDGPAALVPLLYDEIRWRQRNGEQPVLGEYARAFPEQFRALEQALAERPIPGWDKAENLEDTLKNPGRPESPQSPEPATWLVGAASAERGSTDFTERVSDFELLRVLGEGSFGKVYLARQISLDRLVALKMTSDTSSEARTLASLEHDHIVQVFSEQVDRQRNQRLLCMQFVAGPTLERIITELMSRPREQWSGQAILDAIDRMSQHAATFHPAALRDREVLARADFVQAVCWLGVRLAEALDYAHTQGVLHRDIKPANILFSQYGRPMLADFNVSLNTHKVSAAKAGLGGTLAYMSPEHLDACNREGQTRPELVAERADIYSLAVTLFELLTGQRPFPVQLPAGEHTAETLRKMADARRGPPPSARAVCPDVPAVLDGVLRRCLEPDPARRYGSAAELARALEGCREWRHIAAELPHGNRLTQAALRRPFLWLILLALFPQIVSSLVNIAYNWLEIVSRFESQDLEQAFNLVALTYNVLVYPFCTYLLFRQMWPVYRMWKRLHPRNGLPETLARDEVAVGRRRMLSWPAWAVGLSALGWLPGGFLFPLGIDLLAGPMALDVYAHFLISFTLSGLIAMTYTYFGVQFVALRSLYPRFWADPQDLHRDIAAELRERSPRLALFQLLAGVIPLAGAILLVVVGPELTGYLAFRLLAASLILLGMVGFGIAIAANKFLAETLSVLTGADRGR